MIAAPSRKLFNQRALIDSIDSLPQNWALVPVLEKAPKRDDWQYEPPLSRPEIKTKLENGERIWSKRTQRYWHAEYDGVGLRTGDPSGGVIALDIDGHSARPILDALSGGDLPKTTEWASGKPGRSQIAYQLPDGLQRRLKEVGFTHYALKAHDGLTTEKIKKPNGKTEWEQLDFRYNECQSVLPPSKHPDTGLYRWIVSPNECPVAPAPQWLVDWLYGQCDQIEAEAAAQAEKEKARERRRLERSLNPTIAIASGEGDDEFWGYGSEEGLARFLIQHIRLDDLDWYGWAGAMFAARRCGLSISEIEAWSQTSSLHTAKGFRGTWDAAKTPSDKRPATIGTLIHLYLEQGNKAPQRSAFNPLAQLDAIDADIRAEQEERDRIERVQASQGATDAILALLQRQLDQYSKSRQLAATLPILNADEDIQYVDSQLDGYQQGVASGARLIVNRSGTGEGKDYMQGHADPSFWGCDRTIRVVPDLLNVDPNNYNPDHWSKLEGRHLGTVEKDGKLYRATLETLAPDIKHPSNCNFAAAGQEGRKQNIPGSSFIPCYFCANRYKCSESSGDGYGAKHESHQAYKNNQILTNYGRFQGIAAGDEAANLPKTHLSLDEPSTHFDEVKTLEVYPRDIDRSFADLASDHPDLHAKLNPLRRWMMDEAYKHVDNFDRRYGLEQACFAEPLLSLLPGDLESILTALEQFEDDTDVLKRFGLIKDETMTDAQKGRRQRLSKKKIMNAAVEARYDELVCLEKQKNLFKQFSAKEKEELRLYRKEYLSRAEEKELNELNDLFERTRHRNLSPGDVLARFKETRKRWMSEFFSILTGQTRGHIRLTAHGGFEIAIRNEAAIAAIKSAKLVTLTDASEFGSKRLLSQKYGIPASKIFIFKVGKKPADNIKRIHVKGLGKMGRNRGKGLEECKQKLVEELKRLDPTHTHFDAKGYMADAILFRDSISSNAYTHCTSLSATPPRPSLNAALARYCAMTGEIVRKDDPKFQEYYNALYKEQIVQWEGRARANRKPGQHTLYLLTDDELPIEVDEVVRASDLCKGAARKGEKTILALVDAAKWLQEQGSKLTQTALSIASKTLGLNNGKGYCQQHVSKLWEDISARLQLFLYSSTKKSCRSPEAIQGLIEKAKVLEEISQQTQPDLVLEGVIEFCLDMTTPQELAGVIDFVSESARIGILSILLALLPQDLRNDFAQMAAPG